ncbi:acetyltransferase [Frigoribacterium sp. ACAM 257]|uniref:NeuD/PglB/VioB family sugar acetyltransferase n=1 Tax=Frigoribacterium sp. ACAM 257 TaxID=2508998 RepID=UPI0011BA1D0E|nr:NeuD/PglB/VioB family sugar acetyltransferase [Frigoribacterium sp. ACAM 257]TWX34026.1 acetyltransferase [Frigoribacterium sp. ACAM 257]
MTGAVVVVGAGGMGREAVDVARAAGRRVVGVVDDGPSEHDLVRLARLDVPFLGGVDGWIASGSTTPWVVGIGAPSVRRSIAARLAPLAPAAPALVHPAATLGSDVTLDVGTIVCAGARISTHVRIGRHVHLLANSATGHDVVIGDHVSINPGAVVSGAVTVGRDSLVGAGSTVLQQLRVGERCVVAAAACVVRDVADDLVVRGVPAR